MPLYGDYLQRAASEFFNDYNENIKFSFDENDMNSIQKTKNELEETIKLFDEIWLEMMYIEDEYQNYYYNFALENNELELLEDSDYVIYDLDEYHINLENNAFRYWIYEKELSDLRKILKTKKINIDNIINDFNINSAIQLALLVLK